ncbi:MAG: hypothetical protein WC728_10190 [Elusimicrobiota bacterium]
MIHPGLRDLLRDLIKRACAADVSFYLVGGCVRDGLLGVPTRDVDLVTEQDPVRVARASGARLEVFDRFGTLRLSLPSGLRVDIARARAEIYPQPAALPQVRPASLAEDLKRRDFTVNAMALRLTTRGTGPLLDPFLGAADLKAGRLRMLHPASFRDDPTRLYRAARYAGRFGMRLESQTAGLLREAVAGRRPGLLSRDRLRQELMRQMSEKDPGPGMRLIERWGLASFIHPKLRWVGSAVKASDPVVRLGVCALAMGNAGVEMIRSLPLSREQSRAVLTALTLAQSPRAPLPAASLRMLRLHFKDVVPTAFSPLLVDGEDLKKSGLPPGKEYRRWLDAAARAQWRGEFRTRSEALRWLRARLD